MSRQIFPHQYFTLVLLPFLLGVFLATFLKSDFLIFFWLACGFLVLLFLFWKYEFLRLLFLGLIFIFSGAGYLNWRQASIKINLPYGKNVNFLAMISALPEKSGQSQKLVVSPSKNSNMAGKILLTTRDYTTYRYGDILQVSGAITKPEPFENFDWGKYLETQYGVYGVILNPKISQIGAGKGSIFYRAIYFLREKIEGKLTLLLHEPEGGLLHGLLLGGSKQMSQDLQNAFRKAGLSHIVVISGFNITIILKVFHDLIARFWRRLAFAGGILAVLVFVVLTGADSAVVRAGIMGGVMILGYQIGRRGSLSIALLLAGVLMILQNPLVLRFDVGFQLSFLAVLGLAFLSPILGKFFEKMWLIHKTPFIFKEALATTLSAQIFVLPILLFNFKYISLVAPLANVLVLSLIPLTMLLGFVGLVLAFIWIPAGQFFAFIPWIFLHWIVWVAQKLSALPWSALQIEKWNGWLIVGYYIVLAGMLFFLQYKKRPPSP